MVADLLFNPQLILFGVIMIMFTLFLVGKIRYDIVALGALRIYA